MNSITNKLEPLPDFIIKGCALGVELGGTAWLMISQEYKLTEEFIREYQDNVMWPIISKQQILSEDFIREFQDKVDWESIFKYQIFSEEFICEFHHKVN